MSGSDARIIRKYAQGYSKLEPFWHAEEKRVRKLWNAADADLRGRMRRAMQANRRLPQDEPQPRPQYGSISQREYNMLKEFK